MDLVTADPTTSNRAIDKLRLLRRIQETVSVYLACARLAADTVYSDGVEDAVEAITGSRELPESVTHLLEPAHDAGGAAIGPMLGDLEERLEEIRRELLDELSDVLEDMAADSDAGPAHASRF